MASDWGQDPTPSYCGNCGTPVDAGERNCSACGHPLAVSTAANEPVYAQSSPPPADYIPYCRGCGVGVPWGEGNACSRCGVSPLCALHFRAIEALCLDCADTSENRGSAATAGGLRCGACGAAVVPSTGFCPNCGVALATPYAGAEYAGFMMRLAAFIIDWIGAYLLAALIAAIIGISLTAGDVEPVGLEDLTITLENFNYSFLLLFIVISTVHGVIFTLWRGQTLGKMLMKIQVVDASGNIPPRRSALMRELIRGVILMALFPLGLMYIWIAFDSRKRGPHDHLSGSFVVRKQGNARTPSGLF